MFHGIRPTGGNLYHAYFLLFTEAPEDTITIGLLVEAVKGLFLAIPDKLSYYSCEYGMHVKQE